MRWPYHLSSPPRAWTACSKKEVTMSRELALATLAFYCLSARLAATPAYTITSVYALPSGYQALGAGGINDAGVVVGDVTLIGRMGDAWIYNSGSIGFLGFR